MRRIRKRPSAAEPAPQELGSIPESAGASDGAVAIAYADARTPAPPVNDSAAESRNAHTLEKVEPKAADAGAGGDVEARAREETFEPQPVEQAAERMAPERRMPDVAAGGGEEQEAALLPGSDTATRPGLEKAPPLSVSTEHLKSVIESLIFVSDKPLPVNRIAQIARARTTEVQRLIAVLAEEYRGRGVELVEVAGGWQFRSAAANAPFVRDLVARRPVRLTRAQVETLAIVAYRQPVTRPEIEEIRGVDSGSALKVLLERNLIKIIGRKDEPGRPLLYGTTSAFLEFFGLRALSDLPTLKEYSELTEESRELFARKMGESIEDIGDIEIEKRTYSDEELDEVASRAGHAEANENAPVEGAEGENGEEAEPNGGAGPAPSCDASDDDEDEDEDEDEGADGGGDDDDEDEDDNDGKEEES